MGILVWFCSEVEGGEIELIHRTLIDQPVTGLNRGSNGQDLAVRLNLFQGALVDHPITELDGGRAGKLVFSQRTLGESHRHWAGGGSDRTGRRD